MLDSLFEDLLCSDHFVDGLLLVVLLDDGVEHTGEPIDFGEVGLLLIGFEEVVYLGNDVGTDEIAINIQIFEFFLFFESYYKRSACFVVDVVLV